jgi:hypothetical protein
MYEVNVHEKPLREPDVCVMEVYTPDLRNRTGEVVGSAMQDSERRLAGTGRDS